MQEKYLKAFLEIMPALKEIMQDDMTYLVVDVKERTLIALEEGQSLKTPYRLGHKYTDDQWVNFEHIVKTKKRFPSIIPKRFFGEFASGLLNPIIDENGEVVALISVSKSLRKEFELEERVNQIFSSMEQLNSGIEEVASSSQFLSTFVRETLEFSDKTQEKIKEIDSIIQVIKNISSQSNLLALNANIEAARAGEAGRGFSVVANEMGKLSKLSKESAEKVAKSLMEMKQAIETIGEQINKTSITSETQAAATEEIAATTDNVVGIVKELSQTVKRKSIDEMLDELENV